MTRTAELVALAILSCAALWGQASTAVQSFALVDTSWLRYTIKTLPDTPEPVVFDYNWCNFCSGAGCTLMSCGKMPEEMVGERTREMKAARLLRDKRLLRRLMELLIAEIEPELRKP